MLARPLLLVLLLAASLARAELLHGKVVAIADADTLTVLDAAKNQHKIRLSGIDAPEKRQPLGSRSKENLSRLAFDKRTKPLAR
jgi:endonuclease YncB( thermonuclease family)